MLHSNTAVMLIRKVKTILTFYVFLSAVTDHEWGEAEGE